MILVDSNIPMYLLGGSHPHKIDAKRWMEKLLSDGQRLVTDAEVLQEILHRYTSVRRHDAIQPAFDTILGIVDEVLSVDRDVIERAKQILFGHTRLSARDAVHLAVMEQNGITQIFSFDTGFDAFPGITRIPGVTL